MPITGKHLGELIDELLMDSDSDDNDDEISLPEDFHDFLSSSDKGPNLDFEMIQLLSKSGIMDGKSLRTYSQQTFQELVSSITSREPQSLSKNWLANGS
jgi:hypothetical protein